MIYNFQISMKRWSTPLLDWRRQWRPHWGTHEDDDNQVTVCYGGHIKSEPPQGCWDSPRKKHPRSSSESSTLSCYSWSHESNLESSTQDLHRNWAWVIPAAISEKLKDNSKNPWARASVSFYNCSVLIRGTLLCHKRERCAYIRHNTAEPWDISESKIRK